MLKNRLTIIIILAVLMTLVLSSCYRTPEQRAEHIVKHIATTLQLNDTQKAKLDTIKDEFLARRIEMTNVRDETVKEANELMKSDQIEQERLNALIKKNEVLADDTVRFLFAKFNEIHDMLTPEQREKLVAEMQKFHEKGMHHR